VVACGRTPPLSVDSGGVRNQRTPCPCRRFRTRTLSRDCGGVQKQREAAQSAGSAARYAPVAMKTVAVVPVAASASTVTSPSSVVM
jgi:hypothetical protein